MSINLVTDGMLYPIITIPSITAPAGAEGTVGAIPVVPCAPNANPTNPPPQIPTIFSGTGPEIPTTPCGIIANDPTIDPPSIPKDIEGNETPGHAAPAIPKCPEGKIS